MALKQFINNHKRVIHLFLGVVTWFSLYFGIASHWSLQNLGMSCAYAGCALSVGIYFLGLGLFYLGIPLVLLLKRYWWIAGGFVVAAVATGLLIQPAITANKQAGWLTYTTENSGLPDNSIQALQIDDKDRIWVGTFGGLSVLTSNGNWKTYTDFNTGFNQELVAAAAGIQWEKRVNNVLIDSSGNPWVATEIGASRLDSEGHWTSFTYSNASDHIGEGTFTRNLVIDQKNQIWLGDLEGLQALESDGNWKPYPPPNSNAITALTTDTKGQIWALAVDGQLNVLTTDGHWTTYAVPESMPIMNYAHILVDEQGRAWVETGNNRIHRLDLDSTWTTVKFPGSVPAFSDISALLKDKQDRLWVGTYSAGLLCFTPNGDWTVYTFENSGLAEDDSEPQVRKSVSISSLAVDNQDRLWIGTNKGLQVFDLNARK